jgi:RNA polymerase sigma-70 factor, ECF subfamily
LSLENSLPELGVSDGRPASHPLFADSDLATLMTRYQQGDLGAATVLIGNISPKLRRFFAIQLASRDHADDLLQETWLRIHKVRHTYRPGEQVLPWFYAIARHVRVDHYRRTIRTTAREKRLHELPAIAASAPRESALLDLDTLLAPLSESQREVIEMLKVAGMSIEEVARATSTSVSSVKQKVHRAYAKLRKTLRRPFARQQRRGVS